MSAHQGPQTLLAGIDEAQTERRIDAAWDAILLAQDAGKVTDAQFRHLLAQEVAWGDDGTLASRWTFSWYLTAMARRPSMIGVNVGRAKPACGRCDDNGWQEGPDGLFPCRDCNAACYELWSAGCFAPNHECDKCRPQGRRRRARGTSHADELVSESIEAEAEEIAADLF